MSFAKLVKQRFPELDVPRFKDVDLKEVCMQQIRKCN